MKAIEVGTKCVLLKGRRAGTHTVVTKVIDKNFVEIELKKGTTVKKRKCNITHLEPLKA
jgi:large subunit ribosomal protein L14e